MSVRICSLCGARLPLSQTVCNCGWEYTFVYEAPEPPLFFMEFVNLTPHPIRLINEDNSVILEIPPSGRIARVSQSLDLEREVDGVPLYSETFGEIENLPDPEPDTIYIVSSIVSSAAKRADVYHPADFSRDENGRIIGARGLSH